MIYPRFTKLERLLSWFSVPALNNSNPKLLARANPPLAVDGRGAPHSECVPVHLDLCWTVSFAPAQDHRAFLPTWAFSPAGWDPLFQLPVPQAFVWHMASGGLWCSLATPSPGEGPLASLCCFKEPDSYRSPPVRALGSRPWTVHKGVLLGTENDPSFLSQLLTLQNGTGLGDWDIVLHKRHLGSLSTSVPQDRGNL